MKTRLLTSALVLCLMVGAAAQDSDLVSVLKSKDASYKDKADACRELVIVGGVDAVPVLAPMLLDEKTSHIARNALEPMPFPEAGAAIRDALGKTSGRLQLGMISSLAVRKDAEAVPAIAKLLDADDALVAQEAARALGVIATGPAVQALQQAANSGTLSDGTFRAVADALFDVAEGYKKAGRSEEAVAIYREFIRNDAAPEEVIAGAIHGAMLAAGAEQSVPYFERVLNAPEEAYFDALLRVARELDNPQLVADTLAASLPTLDTDRKVRVIHLLGQLGADVSGTLAAAAESDDEAVAVAAVNAIASLGDEEDLPLLVKASWQKEGAVGEAARNAVSYFPTPAGDKALIAMLRGDEAAERQAAITMIGDGGLPDPVDALLASAAGDPDAGVRAAALKALHPYAGESELDPVLKTMLAAKTPEEVRAAESILQSVCGSLKRGASGVVVTKAEYGNLAGGKTADVTKKVRKMVSEGSASIVASNGNFGDPASGTPKQLRIEYEANGKQYTGEVKEGQTLILGAAAIPEATTAKFLRALPTAKGEAELALLRILPTAGGEKALDAVTREALSGSGEAKDTALRTLCGWPTAEALPELTRLAAKGEDQRTKTLALRGAVRLLQQGGDPTVRVEQYASLLEHSATADDKKLVLGALAQTADARVLGLALAQAKDPALRAEAIQTAVAIAENLGANAKADRDLFNGKDLSGWNGTLEFWKVQGDSIVGGGDMEIPRNEFLWSDTPVADFYLVVDVKLTPPTANAGIQFRSQKVDEHGQALGYQADIGEGWWGKLYHEHGRKMLDDNTNAAGVVKPGDWNQYEVLAVGPAIWTAVNGTLCTALLDLDGEAEGGLAFQIHQGAPQTVQYRIRRLVRDPKIEIAGLEAKTLVERMVGE